MRMSERSAQAWPALALAARNRQVLTYDLLGRLLGMPTPALGGVLEPIQSYCLLNRLPPLTALVVSKVTGLPGSGFIAASDVPKVLLDVFEHDWLEHGCPSPEVFAQAVERLPSNGVSNARLADPSMQPGPA